MSLEPLNESMSSGDLKVAIADHVGVDNRERVDTVGNSRAAVTLQKKTLVRIAFRIPNRRGDARDLRDLTVGELREYIARNLDKEPPAGHFNWIHLKAIYQELRGVSA